MLQRPSIDLAAAGPEPGGLAHCLSPAEALEYVRAGARRETGSSDAAPGLDPERVHAHVDDCDRCRVVLAEAAKSAGAGDVAPIGSLRTLADGQTLLGRYEIRRFIARGGMGEVYEAFDSVLGERVALKTLLPTALDDERGMKRLSAEVRLARKVSHPNVCRILEFGFFHSGSGPASGLPFLTMEFLEGEALSRRIFSRGRLDPGTVARLVADVSAGLAAIHGAGIVHRDLKGENVFLVPDVAGDERAVIMDFGLAQGLGDQLRRSSSTAAGGTPDYMAPEQVEGKPPTPAFDIYALGVVMFEMLTGQKPFAGDSPYMAALSRLQRPAPAPSRLVTGLPAVWDEVVGRCLERQPQRRFSRVEEVARALQAGPTGRAGLATARWRRSLAVSVLALGAGGLVLGLRNESRPTGAAAPAASVVAPAAPVVVPAAVALSPASPTAAGPTPRLEPTPATTPVAAPPRPRRGRTLGFQTLLTQAESLMLEGDVAQACALGERAAELAPALPAPQLFLGKCFVRLGDAASARRHYRRYLELAPEAPDAVFVRAILERSR